MNDGSTGLNHLFDAGDDCLTDIAQLFSLIVVSDTASDTFPRSTIKLSTKAKHGPVSDSANFRGITLSLIYVSSLILLFYIDSVIDYPLQSFNFNSIICFLYFTRRV